MSRQRLFQRLCSNEVIRVGWHLAQADSRDDFVTDPVGHADFAWNLTDRIEHLIEQIHDHRYRPRHLIEIDVPKSGLSVRPGNVLPIEEATLLHAIVYLLAPELDRKLDKAVYSYRLHPDWKKRIKKRDSLFREVEPEMPFLKRRTIRSINPFEAWYERWPQFEADALHAYTNEGYTHLTKTDITAYFENIDLRLLETQTRSLLRRDEGETLQLLFRILDGWTRVTSTGTPIGRGIPQGNEVSSFLGNLYLVPLDRALAEFCRKRGGKWFRYVDDVKVFTKSERDAREAVFVINDALRRLHLNLQGSKTEVLSGSSLRAELDNSTLDIVGKTFEAIEKFNPSRPADAKKITKQLAAVSSITSRFRRNLPSSVMNLKPKDHRLFRRLLTLYGRSHRPHLRWAAVAAMKELPDLRILHKALTYLAQLPYKTHRESFDEIMTLIETDQLPFPFQVGVALAKLGDFHPSQPSADASRIRKASLATKRNWFVSQKAIQAMLTCPYHPRHALSIADQFLKHDHPMVRRAACAFLLRGPAAEVRNRLHELTHHPDNGLSRLALYFLRFLSDPSCVQQELDRFRKGRGTDFAFLRALPQLYAMAATQDASIASRLQIYVGGLSNSPSERIEWHKNRLLAAIAWSGQNKDTAAVRGRTTRTRERKPITRQRSRGRK